MSTQNPYSVGQASTESALPEFRDVRNVSVRPFELYRRAMQLIGDQYWLFLGITFVGIAVGSLVPFGIIMGALLVGIFHCYIQCEHRQRVDFGMLFTGFDHFIEALIAMLIMTATMFFVVVPFMIIFGILMIAIMAGNPDEPPPEMVFLFITMYPCLLLANIIAYIPFMFVFPLIADRGLKAFPAIKLSVQGVIKNPIGIAWFTLVNGALSVLLTFMCLFPVLFFMPIYFGALFLLYRDIFGEAPILASEVPA